MKNYFFDARMPELPISSLASLLFVLERKGGKTGRKGKNPRWQIERFSATGSTDFMPFCTAAAAALGDGGKGGGILRCAL